MQVNFYLKTTFKRGNFAATTVLFPGRRICRTDWLIQINFSVFICFPRFKIKEKQQSSILLRNTFSMLFEKKKKKHFHNLTNLKYCV